MIRFRPHMNITLVFMMLSCYISYQLKQLNFFPTVMSNRYAPFVLCEEHPNDLLHVPPSSYWFPVVQAVVCPPFITVRSTVHYLPRNKAAIAAACFCSPHALALARSVGSVKALELRVLSYVAPFTLKFNTGRDLYSS